MTTIIETKVRNMTNEEFRIALHLFLNNRTHNSMYAFILRSCGLSCEEFAEYVKSI